MVDNARVVQTDIMATQRSHPRDRLGHDCLDKRNHSDNRGWNCLQPRFFWNKPRSRSMRLSELQNKNLVCEVCGENIDKSHDGRSRVGRGQHMARFDFVIVAVRSTST